MDKVSIIIVSWNVRELLKKCLESIYRHRADLDIEIIVIDNNSGDDTVDMIKQNFPEIKVIGNHNNLGFGAANNQGIKQSTGDYILLLNPDTEIRNNALRKTLDFIKTNDRAGIVGCKHLNPDLTLQPSVRRFPKPLAIFLILTKLAKIFPTWPPIYKYLYKDFNYKQSQVVDQVNGSFMLIKKELLQEIGGFDENFFIWFEEVDLCRRAKKVLWEVWYFAQAEIIHHGGQSFKQQLTFKKQKLFFKSALYYFQKHGIK